MDDVTRCPVCFEDYGDSEHLLPRLLPCTHKFCSTCIELLIRDSKLVCPLDQREHDAEQGVTTFAQNRYILRSGNNSSLDGNDVFAICEQHNRPKSMYCKRAECDIPVCQLCIFQHHKTHEVVYIKHVIDSMKEPFARAAELIRSNLQSSKKKVEDEKRSLQETTASIVKSLLDSSENSVKRFDSKLSGIKGLTAAVNAISESITEKTSFDEMKQKFQAVEGVRKEMRQTLKDCSFFKIWYMEGSDKEINFTEERDAIWFNAKINSGKRH